jgi:peroxiredoxin Q/BCP
MYKQEVNLFKLGRMPLNCVIDPKGYIRFVHYGNSMSDIPSNEELLNVIDELNAASK